MFLLYPMKPMKLIPLIIAASVLATSAIAAEKIQAGPKGGRILAKTEPKAEFFLEKDRTATITFYDAKLKPVAAKDQSASVVVEKQTIEFEKKGDVLASKSKLPEGDALPIVVQLKSNADAKPQNFRLKLDTHICGGCKRAEYACTCDH
jgi:hypothetical protein